MAPNNQDNKHLLYGLEGVCHMAVKSQYSKAKSFCLMLQRLS